MTPEVEAAVEKLKAALEELQNLTPVHIYDEDCDGGIYTVNRIEDADTLFAGMPEEKRGYCGYFGIFIVAHMWDE